MFRSTLCWLNDWFPIAYYLPRNAVTDAFKITQVPNKASLCEWKGRATYWELSDKSSGESVKSKVWSYEAPTPAFTDIKGYLSFYASGVPWECFVDDEKVAPQEGESSRLDADRPGNPEFDLNTGDFYGGWVTSELEGPMKGGPGTWGW